MGGAREKGTGRAGAEAAGEERERGDLCTRRIERDKKQHILFVRLCPPPFQNGFVLRGCRLAKCLCWSLTEVQFGSLQLMCSGFTCKIFSIF